MQRASLPHVPRPQGSVLTDPMRDNMRHALYVAPPGKSCGRREPAPASRGITTTPMAWPNSRVVTTNGGYETASPPLLVVIVVWLFWVSQRPEAASGRHSERVPAEEVHVLESQGRQAGHVFVADLVALVALGPQLLESGIHVDGVPQDHGAQDEPRAPSWSSCPSR